MQPELDLDLLSLDEYRRNEFAPRLMPSEELALLGRWQPKRDAFELPCHKDCETVTFVCEKEHALRQKYVKERKSTNRSRFPLVRPKNCTGLEGKIYEDLEMSYRTNSGLRTKEIRAVTLEDIEGVKQHIQNRRLSLELSVLAKLSEGDQSSEHRMSQFTGRTAVVSTIDILRTVCDEATIALFNPFLDLDSRIQLQLQSVDWLSSVF